MWLRMRLSVHCLRTRERLRRAERAHAVLSAGLCDAHARERAGPGACAWVCIGRGLEARVWV